MIDVVTLMYRYTPNTDTSHNNTVFTFMFPKCDLMFDEGGKTSGFKGLLPKF